MSVLFWTRYNGDGCSLAPHGKLRLSTNNGATWRVVGIVAGSAPVYYPERIVIDGVRFGWPFGEQSGEVAIYYWAGRRVWHRAVAAGGGSVDPWDVGSGGIGNGVYLAVARAGNRIARRKLFVARTGGGG